MEVTLIKQACGHVAGTTVGVSDDRAYLWMVNGIAKPDKKFLSARKVEAERLLAQAEKDEKAAKARAEKAAKKEKTGVKNNEK